MSFYLTSNAKRPDMLHRRIMILLLAAGVMGLTGFNLSAPADQPQVQAQVEVDDDIDHDEARRALKSGLVRPLEEILAEVKKTIEGDIIEIEFDKEGEDYIYELEIIRPDGRLVEIKVDAKTMKIREMEDD
jgi:uncharacterized membrane protein YkoI